MRVLVVLSLVLATASTASAELQSAIGGKALTEETVHNTGVGYPGIFYEWWNNGKALDWALGVGLVYGDWQGGVEHDGNANNRRRRNFIRIGAEFYAPLRWHLKTGQHPRTTIDTSFRLTPGLLLAGSESDMFVFGMRAELAVPVSIKVHERVNVVTGGTIPVTVYIVENPGSDGVAIPLYIRQGVEVDAGKRVSPWFLLEIGPEITVFGGVTDVDFGFRVWVGGTFWSLLK